MSMGRHQSLSQFWEWFEQKTSQNLFQVEPIPFVDLEHWQLDPQTGNLHHASGKFFSVEGLRVKTNFGPVASWDQPIINQPEVGILGIITKIVDHKRYFLMQAKMEPGNVNVIQLSPTVQATKSNYTQVHKGKLPLYLEYFIHPEEHGAKVLVDVPQPEQGGRFLKKLNRNMVLEVSGDVAVSEDFFWLTLKQIKALMRFDNVVNMNTRTVVASIPEPGADASEVLEWMAQVRQTFTLSQHLIPLRQVEGWRNSGDEIAHHSRTFFSVIAVHVEASNREVTSWSQPLFKDAGVGLIGFIKQGDSYLVQAKVEPGNRQVIDLAPTVSFSHYQSRLQSEGGPAFINDFIQAKPENIIFDTVLSEEGGRFYHAQNRYMIIKAEPEMIPAHYKWITRKQMATLMKNSLFNIEARSLIATL